jgi:signal transduction histidine kinase
VSSDVAVEWVLVVDDNAENRALAAATLADADIGCTLARSGPEALAAVAQKAFDCILLDIRMPGMDGIEVCERIRALPGGDRVAILFVTAQREVETFDRALAAGGDDFVTKPFRPDELIVRIQTATRLRRMSAVSRALAGELRHQRDELRRLQLQKEQLTQFLVHDLKNPVNSIQLQAQRVLRHADADARSRDAAEKITGETQALLRMITNLLDLGKADEGLLAPARTLVDLPALVASVITELEPRAAAAAVTLVTEVSAVGAELDPDLVRRVIANLVDNAIDHAPERSTITVSLEARGRGVRLRVIDRGCGVPETQREQVFDRFMSARTTLTNRGLGLAFCRVAVEAHGGKIWIEDAAPGAVFCVDLP